MAVPLSNLVPSDDCRAFAGGFRRSSGSLPIVDIGPLYRRDLAGRRRVADAIGEATREFGFLYITNPVIPQTLIDAVYENARRFFALPHERKLRYYIAHSRAHRGYVPIHERGLYTDERVRLYEAFDLALDLDRDDPDYDQGHRLLGPNVWPALPEFRDTVYAYYQAVAALAQTLCRAFELHLRLPPGYFRQFMRKPNSQLRLLHYLENDEPRDDKDMQMGAHTDYEALTILHQSLPGLQVLTTDDQWLDASPIDGTYVINIGDMMETWTNGRLRATPHRVVNTGRERFSLPYFCAADFDARIEPVPTVLDDDKTKRYPSLIAGHHLLDQMLRDFAYLRRRVDTGALSLPFVPTGANPFEDRLAQQAAV